MYSKVIKTDLQWNKNQHDEPKMPENNIEIEFIIRIQSSLTDWQNILLGK